MEITRTTTGAQQLDAAIAQAAAALRHRQHPDGHWRFELETDAAIPAEYILLEHYLDRISPALQSRIAVYLRGLQAAHGGWPLFHGGAFDLSASVKAYFALKAAGDSADAPHMQRARAAILAHGGAERANVFTRIQLALFGQLPWRAIPTMPVELLLAPKWFFFHLSKVSYWSRIVLVPLLVLLAHRPRARNPHKIHVRELFTRPPHAIRDYIGGPYRSSWGRAFKILDSILKRTAPVTPRILRRHAINRAVDFVTVRRNGTDGPGAIYPAMAYSVMMFDVLGYPKGHPHLEGAWLSVRRLIVDDGTRAYCQPCHSPVWDTALAGHALAEAAYGTDIPPARLHAACAWLAGRQILDVTGDWSVRRPHLRPGGWAFQYNNPHYPDVDDTAAVAMLLHRTAGAEYAAAISRARDWIIGMQSSNGGWGAYDPENTHEFLNHIPFADHGALLDPPTADVTARCVSFLAQAGLPAHAPVLHNALAFLRRTQEPFGAWFGRWGTNYIYGTWSVLSALNAAGIAPTDPMVVRACDWLLSVQRDDGGWGESEMTYRGAAPGTLNESTPSQTSWALLGLINAGRAAQPAVARGIAWLQSNQTANGEWQELPHTGVGFPKVLYLRYHGYRQFFPLLALSRYRNVIRANQNHQILGL
jgi:squalene-hopene/tetraprenyl-beta-curcumene cyclase